MEKEQNYVEYRDNDADTLIGELFSGRVTVGEAIEQLRTRLLDLSARNRLLNYRHPKGRCIQIADEPNTDLVFNRLFVDGKGVLFKYVPEPLPDTYEGKRPEAKLYAQRLGISTSFEFPPNLLGSNGRRLHGIQTLLYPAELERQLRKISGEAKTAIEETGTNMLFLVFGFLEFFDSEDSERPMHAPLISLPVTLVRGEIDKETRTYLYTVQHNGEDLAENYTLKEKLRRDFMLSLPEFEEEDELETYFVRIEQAVKNKRRWKVRRQITLGMLSFGKLAIWADLDTKKNPGLTEHELIKSVFSGGSGCGDGERLHAEDYRIDELPEAVQPLIYDADSSQHSAIIDVLSGKNLVINGPPGTGKSQTITNIIAAMLSQGKKVLFVSEKLAALEVVRHRLNHAGLGHFCLELHSHKTQKKKFLEDIQARIEECFPPPEQFQAKLVMLQRQKKELARYAELMGSRVGNALGLTINEVFWAAERRRQELGDLAAEINAIGFPDASHWTQDDIEFRQSRLAGLAELYDTIGNFGPSHPWWGFWPDPLAPADDESIALIIQQALNYAVGANAAADEIVVFFSLRDQPATDEAIKVSETLEMVPPVPEEIFPELLAQMFDDESDPKGHRSSRLLTEIIVGVTKSRRLFESADQVLIEGNRISREEVVRLKEIVDKGNLSTALLSIEIGKALEIVARLERAVDCFESAVLTSAVPFGLTEKTAVDSFLANCGKPFALKLAPLPIRLIAERASATLEITKRISEAVAKVNSIAERRGLVFDSTPDSIARMADYDRLPGFNKEARIDKVSLTDARRYVTLPLTDYSLNEIGRIRDLLEAEASAYSEALARCQQTTERLGMTFDYTEQAIAEVAALAKVATIAPSDLLEYRRSTFGHSRTVELIDKIRLSLSIEHEGKITFSSLFYLDTLPAISKIKSAITPMRQRDGFFAFFDGEWRKAKRLHSNLCKEKRKISVKQRAEELAGLVSWIEARDSFAADLEFKECFGGLFRGTETDLEKIIRLNDWYVAGRSTLLECPGLTEKIDLSTLPSDRILELAAKAKSVLIDVERLNRSDTVIRNILGTDFIGFHEAKSRRWNDAIDSLKEMVANLGKLFEFFSDLVDHTLSPKDALRLLEAREELKGISSELSLILRSEQALRDAGSEELGILVDLAGSRWSDVSIAVSSLSSAAAETAGQALRFAKGDLPLSVAEFFARSKSELDAAWSRVVPLPKLDRLDDWSSFIEVVREDASTARSAFERIAPFARLGSSVSDVFKAMDEETEALSILESFACSDEVFRVLGNKFVGAATDLDRLTQTHQWGAAVCELEMPIAVRRKLLSKDAWESLKTARHLYGSVAAGCLESRKMVERLVSYGAFTWNEWQRRMRSTHGSGRDLPCEITERLESLMSMTGSVLPWSKYLSARLQAQEDGLADFVSALESKRMPSAVLARSFELAAYQSIGRSIYQTFPELSRFNGSAHAKTRLNYQSLDAEIISLAGRDFANLIERRSHVPEGQRGTSVGDYTDMHLLRREINKQRRHIPIRQLVKRAGRALQELKPCFMMGPLSVAQYLELGALKFDLIVMDEASQLRPEEAIGAIARGSQLVVVGDPKQLPPTSFFDRMLDVGDDEDEDDAPAAITGMESILDICQQLFTPVRSLRWHYRSHHESLIAFSNHHFYKNLIIFPSPYAKNPGLGVKYRYVRRGLYKDRQNVPEAQCLVDAVLEHMIKRPHESLGVVTLNQTQRELIEELLDKKLKTFNEGAIFLERWEAEGWPFFVKNLENVQGDERDVIFISTTFGKAPGTNKVRQNFGPISRPDGWRRLNVLFTRSKRRIELFTSMVAEDLIVDEKTPLGTKALRDYLAFAKRGVLVTTDECERGPDSDFEVSVANVVTALGYEVKPQLGVAGFFIDIAVRNPDRPGEFLAGIECDGATYHSGFSVRDRDRIRQEILESLGWKGRIYRIWSTDWFYNPRKESERLRSFLDERRRLVSVEADSDWEEQEFDDGQVEASSEAIDNLVESVTASSSREDLFVEVGDQVVYCPLDDPNDKHSILILDSPSNVKRGVINELTPLAQALLGLSSGDIGELDVTGQNKRKLRVLKILRQEDLLA
jgi:transcription elongation GreA/GreB family factor